MTILVVLIVIIGAAAYLVNDRHSPKRMEERAALEKYSFR